MKMSDKEERIVAAQDRFEKRKKEEQLSLAAADAFIIAVGGSGIRAMHAFLHICTAGMCDKKKIGILVVDTDSIDNGNTYLLEQQYDRYRSLRKKESLLARFDLPEITILFACDLADGINSIGQSVLTAASPQERFFAHALLSREDISSDKSKLEDGLFGCPTRGAFLFHHLRTGKASGSAKKIEAFFQLAKGKDEAKILFVGSSFGGTGTSGIPELLRWFQSRSSKIAVSMLTPYFKLEGVHKKGENYTPGIAKTKSREALQQYLDFSKQESLQALYLIGLPENDEFPLRGKQEPNGHEQENWPHICELIAALSFCNYFSDGGPDNGMVYTYEDEAIEKALREGPWDKLIAYELFVRVWYLDFSLALEEEEATLRDRGRKKPKRSETLHWRNTHGFRNDWKDDYGKHENWNTMEFGQLQAFCADYLEWFRRARNIYNSTAQVDQSALLSVATVCTNEEKMDIVRRKLWREASGYPSEDAADLIFWLHQRSAGLYVKNMKTTYESRQSVVLHHLNALRTKGWSEQGTTDDVSNKVKVTPVIGGKHSLESGWPLAEGHIKKYSSLLTDLKYSDVAADRLFTENVDELTRTVEDWLLLVSLLALHHPADHNNALHHISAARCKFCCKSSNTDFEFFSPKPDDDGLLSPEEFEKFTKTVFANSGLPYIITLQWCPDNSHSHIVECLDSAQPQCAVCAESPLVLGVVHDSALILPSKDFCTICQHGRLLRGEREVLDDIVKTMPNELRKAMGVVRKLWAIKSTDSMGDTKKQEQLSYIKFFLEYLAQCCAAVDSQHTLCKFGLRKLINVEMQTGLSFHQVQHKLNGVNTILPILSYPEA
ncbi:MAG: hypothetical protein FWH55_10930 [Oscillospiraceae bacterium]|nr:hypothetical protein [Oscillospiraceae bacterium]